MKPQALTPALDVTPGEEGGGGPLGSVVLAEQIKRAGALKEVRGGLQQIVFGASPGPRKGIRAGMMGWPGRVLVVRCALYIETLGSRLYIWGECSGRARIGEN